MKKDCEDVVQKEVKWVSHRCGAAPTQGVSPGLVGIGVSLAGERRDCGPKRAAARTGIASPQMLTCSGSSG